MSDYYEQKVADLTDEVEMQEQSIVLLERSIYRKCYECSGEVRAEVVRCEIEDCPLYKYRLEGK